ncbi:S6 family peptidase [Mannheimia pernigra]|uniref:S6 family peptidase n=1 Tax=Mannheimia pernigra TaxID=111844 RepID=UPI00159F3548|nr:S6 family peptidase [Mannheimia pernigra]QLB43610.1 autotransporter domain-containing protein [Mannheimia pernigra]
MKKAFTLSFLATTLASILPLSTYAAIVRGDVDYQYFRDLAENKGKFFVGATNIPVLNNKDQQIGTFLNVTPKKLIEIEPPRFDVSLCFSDNPPPQCNGEEPPRYKEVILDPVEIPMIDFSSINRTLGFATLVNPQYVISVNHNQSYNSVQFGDSSSNKLDDHHYDYRLVKRNNYQPDPAKLKADKGKNGESRERNDNGEKIIYDISNKPTDRWDYHAPRLAKLVTEVVPAKQIEPENGQSLYDYYEQFGDRTLFPMFIRAGSGKQAIVNNITDRLKKGRIEIGSGTFLIGGSVLPVSSDTDNGLSKILVALSNKTNDVFQDHGYGPLTTIGLPGDSGSAIWGYNLKKKEWVVLGVYSDYFSEGNIPGGDVFKSYWNYHHPHYVRALEKENTAGTITTTGATLTWKPQGNSSTISDGTTSLKVDLADTALPTLKGHNGNINDNPWNPQLHHGKTFHINGENNTFILTGDVNQGAGAIHIHSNATFQGETDNISWLGAGLDIDKDKTVTWKLHNPNGDRLSKIGKGTLLVNGKGKNLGSISVGDGTLILDQQADENGEKSAFSEVGIVSGRPTVILNSANQVNPNNIYFGYRGGKLDLNGHSITMHRIQNSDDGAVIVNNNAQKAAKLHLTGIASPTAEQVKVTAISRPDQISPNMATTDIFAFQRLPNQPTNYIRLKKPLTVKQITEIFNARKLFVDIDIRTGLIRDNEYFETLGTNEDLAKSKVLAEKVKSAEGSFLPYSGYFGERDANNKGILDVIVNTEVANGKLLITGGTNLNGNLIAEGTSELILSGRPTPHAYDHLKNQEVIVEGDWLNRKFSATTFTAKDNGKIEVSRNVSNVTGHFNLANNATAQIGFSQSKSQQCIRSDRTGMTTCNVATLSDADLNSWERTIVNGNATLNDNSTFRLGSKATMSGSITAEETTHLQLDNGSVLNLTGISKTGHFTADTGSTVNLSSTLTILTSTVLDVLNMASGTLELRGTLTANTLSGNGVFKFTTDLAQTTSNVVKIIGSASGQFTAEISPIKEANSLDKIKLLEISGENNFSLTLKEPMESGEYTYDLEKVGMAYYLKPTKKEEPKITQKGESVTADPLPEYTGTVEITKKGESVTAEPLPEYTGLVEITKKGESVTADPLPEYTGLVEITKKGESVTADPLPEYTGLVETTQKGESVTADPLPEYTGLVEITKKGESVTADPLPEYTGLVETTQKGESVTADPLPEYTGTVEITKKGESVTADPLPEYTGLVEITKKGESVTADPLSEYTGLVETTQKGESVTAEPLPEYTGLVETTQKGESVTADPLPEYTGLVETTQKGESVTADPLPEYTGLVETTQKGESVTADPLPEYTGLVETTQKGESVTAEPLPEYKDSTIFVSEPAAQINALLSLTTEVDKAIISPSTNNQKVWANIGTTDSTYRSTINNFNQRLTQTHLGVESVLNNNIVIGAILSKSQSKNDFKQSFNGKGTTTMLSLYGKKEWENGISIGIDTSLGKTQNTVTYMDKSTKFNRDIIVVGVNISKYWAVQGFNIKPTMGVRYYHLSSVNYPLPMANINTPSVDLVSYQAGLSISKTFDINKVKITPEISSYILNVNHGKLKTQINARNLEQGIGNQFKQEMGISLSFHNWNTRINAGILKGNKRQNQKSLSFKIGYEW